MPSREFVVLATYLLLGWVVVVLPVVILLLSRRDPPQPRGPRWTR